MCGENQIAEVDKCVCEEGFYDCDDNAADCEAVKECQELLENCGDRIDNDEDDLTDCEDLLDCKTGSFCGQGPADEPMYCYEGDCSSTTCGDGICDADETLFSCPPDCKLTKPVCGDEVCSGNETEVSCPEDCSICPEGQILNEKGVCVIEVVCPIGYTAGINDTCTPEECLDEGGTYMPGDEQQCCVGLGSITITTGDGTECTLPMGYVCTGFCGDGTCEGEYENACSCPGDCLEVNVTPRNVTPVNVTPVNVTCLEGQEVSEGICVDICGNGIIDEGEDCENCVLDVICEDGYTCENRECTEINITVPTCPEGQEPDESGECVEECLREGEDYLPGEGKCCFGFKSMSQSVGDGEICSLTAGHICTALCGNEVCDNTENPCNCPEDCREEEELCGNVMIDEGEDCESCPSDVVCQQGYVCTDGECIPILGVCPEGMEPNEVDQCVDICGNGRINEGEDCESCPTDVICRENFVCENKECVPEGIVCPEGYILTEENTCELIIECGEGYRLTDQGCIPIEDECRQNKDCIGREKCKAGVCVAPPRPICEDDEECPQNKICSEGICVKIIETPDAPEPEPTGEECVLISDCSGENDICSNGVCKELPEEVIEEEEEEEVIPEEEPEEPEEEIPEEVEEEEEIEEEPEEIEEEEEPEEIEEEEPEDVEEEPEPVEEEPEPEPEPVEEEPEPEPVQEEPEEPEVTGESILDVITTNAIKIFGLATEEGTEENGCQEDSDCNPNQNCDPYSGNCWCKEYFFDCNSRDRQGNDDDGCESEDPTCGGEREMCEGGCNENQYCDEKRGNCMCDEGFWECDGYWGNGCESEEMCDGCEDDSDCMQDVCAPWDIKHVIKFGCVEGSSWKEERGAVAFSGGCNFHPTGRVDGYIGFDAWGESFEQVQRYTESMEQFERNWCEFEFENLVKQRIELQESYNQEFLAWFFEEYVNSEPDKWDKHMGGIFDAYWKFIDNSMQMNRVIKCLNQNKFPSEYELINEIEYESEYGHLKFWEEKAVLEGVEIFSPYMQVWIFPPKEFVKDNFRIAMEKGIMPGPPEKGEQPGPTPAEIKKAKQDKKFMEEIRDISDDFGGSADFLITINDDDETLYKAMLTINPEVIFNFEVKNIDREPDVTIRVDFDFLYGIIESTEKEMETERPPWDERPRMRERIKGAMDKGKMIAKITGAIATGKIKVSPLSQVGKVTKVLGFMFEQGPKEKGPRDEGSGEEGEEEPRDDKPKGKEKKG